MHVDLNEEGIYMMGADGSLPTHGQGSPKSCNQSLQTPRNVLLREMRGRMDGFALPGHYSKAKQGRVVRQMEKRFFVKLVFELLHAFKKASQTLCCSFAPAPGTCCLLLLLLLLLLARCCWLLLPLLRPGHVAIPGQAFAAKRAPVVSFTSFRPLLGHKCFSFAPAPSSFNSAMEMSPLPQITRTQQRECVPLPGSILY